MDQSVDRHLEVTDSEREAFVALYRAEYPGMVRLAHVLTGSAETAEDVTQEAFARIQQKSSIENPGGYLRTTVVNLCRDRQRVAGRERRAVHLVPHDSELSLDATEVIDVLLRLPYRQRAVLVLRYWCDWTEADIAQTLGCRPGTVKTLASRGLTRLRKEIT